MKSRDSLNINRPQSPGTSILDRVRHSYRSHLTADNVDITADTTKITADSYTEPEPEEE